MSRLHPILPYLALSFFALFAALPLASPRLLCTDDSIYHIGKAVGLEVALRGGHFAPRWMPFMAHGYGYPHFNYYAPLASYVLVGLHDLSLIYPAAYHVLLALCIWLAGAGMYALVRDWWGEAAGLAAGVVYLSAPYLAFNVMVRGALAETFALAWPPIILLTLQRALTRPGAGYTAFGRWDIFAALAFGALIYTHNATALAVAPLAASFVALHTGLTRDGRTLFRGAIILLLGLALSASFWLPALAERDLVQSDRLLVPPIFTYYTNFISVRELVAPPAVVDPLLVNPSPAKGLGLVAAVLAVLGFAALAFRSYRAPRISAPKHEAQPPPLGPGAAPAPRTSLAFGAWALLALLAYALLTQSIARPVWDRAPLLPFLQFPWRLLGPAALCAAILAGAAVLWLPRRPAHLAFAIGLVASLGHLSWWYGRECDPFEEVTLADTLRIEYATFTIGTTAKGEFLPVTVHRFPESDAVAEAIMRGETPVYLNHLPAGAEARQVRADPVDYQAVVYTPTAFRATFNQFHFPGWRAWLEGRPVPLRPDPVTGLITVDIPAGTSTLEVRFGNTPVRTAAEATSLAGLALLIALGVAGLCSKAPTSEPNLVPNQSSSAGPWSLAALGLTLVILRALVIDRTTNPLRHSGFDRGAGTVAAARHPLLADFEGGVRLHGYDLSSTTLPADGFVDVTLYISVREHITRGFWPAFYLEDDEGFVWNDPNALPPRWHKEPTSPAAWSPDQYAQWARHLEPFPGTPPGTYRLSAEIFDLASLRIASLIDGQGNAFGPRLSLGTLTVTRPRRPFSLTPEQPAAHGFGPVVLLGGNVDRTEALAGEAMSLTLYWQSVAVTQSDLAARVTLVDQGGEPAHSVELPIVQTYPTSAWQPGDQWRAQHRLRLPATLAEGQYQLSISVSSREDAQSLGVLTVRAPTRSFSRPAVQHENGAVFEGVARLDGYSVVRRPDAVEVTLVWNAIGTPALGHAVFLHLADDHGRIWSQSDAVPVGGARPTTGWVAGEYLEDKHTLSLPADLPPGDYDLFAGLYDPGSGLRVPASGPGAGSDDRVLIASLALP